MRTHLTLPAFIVFALTASTSFADAECRQGGLQRNVTVIFSQPGQPVPCEVLYEKPGEGESLTLWRAQNEAGFCEARAEEFIAKLESLGWDCAAPSDAQPAPDPA